MARGIQINTISWDIEHYKRIERYAKIVDQIYQQAINEAARLGTSISNHNPSKLFAFSSYPQTQQRVREIFGNLSRDIRGVMLNGMSEEWLQSAKKNDAFVDYISQKTELSKDQLSGYYQQNLEALKAFQKRKIKGLSLSERVWQYTNQFKREIELALDVGLAQGKSAQSLSQDMRQYLNNPDKLFRKVRDKHGNLQLSKAAKAYHPGQGVYRSSYKNAMRLTRTEINMAYRMSDMERWQQLDFIVGYEVRLSAMHPRYDICDELQGRYPKRFIFRGWHPQCLCHSVPVMLTPEEFNKFEAQKLQGKSVKNLNSSQQVQDVPAGFKDWIANNTERVKGWKSRPFFIRDNFKYGNIEKGLKIEVENVSGSLS